MVIIIEGRNVKGDGANALLCALSLVQSVHLKSRLRLSWMPVLALMSYMKEIKDQAADS